MKYIVTLCRILVGVLFIISGFIKANDTLGFSYKLDEYFTVFGTPFMQSISLPMAQLICVAEIVLGFATLVGWRMVLVSWLLLLMIVFFTFLTFYSAYFDVVKDCGCFGDALHLKPWESFGKDIALLILILPIFVWRKKIQPLFSAGFANRITALSLVASSIFTYITYAHLPVIDFRPFAIGKNINDGMTLPQGAITDSVVVMFKYKKKADGTMHNFSMNALPEDLDNYEYVDRTDKLVREGDKPKIHDFSISDKEGGDYTEDFLHDPNYSFMLVCYDLEKASAKNFEKINALAQACEKNKIRFFGITSTAAAKTDEIRHEHNLMFDFYFCDATALKTIIRSNPGLVLLKNGTVIDMWHNNDIPAFEEVKAKDMK